MKENKDMLKGIIEKYIAEQKKLPSGLDGDRAVEYIVGRIGSGGAQNAVWEYLHGADRLSTEDRESLKSYCSDILYLPDVSPRHKKAASGRYAMKVFAYGQGAYGFDSDDLSAYIEAKKGPTFAQTVNQYIIAKKLKNSDVYSRGGFSRQEFSRVMNMEKQARVSKKIAMQFALGLQLDYESARKLLRTAGYAFSRSSVFDLVVACMIRQGIYNPVVINCYLSEFGQDTFNITYEQGSSDNDI